MNNGYATRPPSARRQRLRASLAASGPTVAPGVYDLISLRLAERAGFETLFMSGYGVVASALGLLPMLFGLTSVIGVALGVIALNRMRFTGESGRGLAIAGIAVGAVTFLASWLIGIAFLTSGPALR